jgi:hypothetical protein
MTYTLTNCSLYKYGDLGLLAVEHPTSSGKKHDNVLVFIGGLCNGVTDVPYVQPLAQELDKLDWGLIEINTRSSYNGWATGSLSRDAEDISSAINYFKTNLNKAKVAIMGHSTGCQDVMYYLTQQYKDDSNNLIQRPHVDGAILQASVSDREALTMHWGQQESQRRLKLAEEWVRKGEGKSVLPAEYNMFGASITAERLVSLLAVRGGDDFFSFDLDEQDFKKTFGSMPSRTKFLVCYSEKDQFVPVEKNFVDRHELLSRWKKSSTAGIWSDLSTVIKGATHDVGADSEKGALESLVNVVTKFVANIS